MELSKIILNKIGQKFPHLESKIRYKPNRIIDKSKTISGKDFDAGFQIFIEYDKIFDDRDCNEIIEIVNIFESEDYKLGKTVVLSYYSPNKILMSDYIPTNYKLFTNIIDKVKDGVFYSSWNDVIDLIGKKIVKIELSEDWCEIDPIAVRSMSKTIKHQQSLINSNPNYLDDYDTKIDGNSQFWFITDLTKNPTIKKGYKDFNINPGSTNTMALVVKVGDESPKVVGCIDFYTRKTSYQTDTILILPKYRGKGYSKVMDEYIIEKTGLKYSTNLTLTKDGFFKMRANKKILPWESFVNLF